MKYCPQCHHTYTDETIKFCRVDGTLLQANGSLPVESSDALILPAAPVSDSLPTQLLRSETPQSKEITSPLEKLSGSHTDGASNIRTTSSAEYLTSEIKKHQRGDNLTISVELVDVRNNKLLWGEQYDRKMTDLLATQRGEKEQ